ncbi:MAG: tRNA-specific 2-thiouridylase MnmA [Alphaproteobacteria bacterium MarineAlpha8_Bin1]|nr:MAG: tRNA-specific 2-thiouridylase MnmA [Alphaproteobacteria bacterium MarineAlpha8_Bin1]|tara:strand:- start:13 stop:1164 length:1152 start_codon:yes stop_codon:yes gene_type:complete
MEINFSEFKEINNLPNKAVRVVVAMSGGVDSSVAAALMVKAGFDVVGVTMKLYDDKRKKVTSKTCCTGVDVLDAQEVAKSLGIKHYVLDYQDTFRKEVINDFINSYENGSTPIPCIKCNQTVKFTDLIQFTKSVNSEILVTGHYVKRATIDGNTILFQANDLDKDQSYFLFSTTREQLKFLRFPLGHYKKTEIRNLAKFFKLKNSEKADSQDICFVPSGDYKQFLKNKLKKPQSSGHIIDSFDQIIGKHDGIYRYTIGQRRGIGVGGIKGNENQKPLYVLEIDKKNNTIKVGSKKDLEKYKIYLNNIHLISDINKNQLNVDIKLRSSQKKMNAKINLSKESSNAVVELKYPAFGVSPGQACVFYKKDKLLGGGWIVAAEKDAN